MSGAEKLPGSLKAHAQATLFADMRVTTAMKERLRRRIQELPSAPERTKRPRTWLSRGYAAAGAAAACALVIGQAALNYAPVPPDRAGQPAQVPPPPAAAQPASDPSPLVNLNPAVFKVTVADQAGTTVVTSESRTRVDGITFTDANGNDITTGPAPAVAGVEVQPGRKVVLNAEYHLKVDDARGTAASLQQLALTSQGYVVEANLNQGTDGSWAGRVILRIPATRYGEATQAVGQFGEVLKQRQWSQDVTEQYLDAERRIGILTEFETKLQELAREADTFDDWLKLTRQINETRSEIERLQGNLKLLANQVDFSTVTVTLEQPASAAAAAGGDADPSIWSQMGRAFGGSLQVLGRAGRGMMLGVAGAVPFLVLGLLGGGAVLLALRARRRGRSTPGPEQP